MGVDNPRCDHEIAGVAGINGVRASGNVIVRRDRGDRTVLDMNGSGTFAVRQHDPLPANDEHRISTLSTARGARRVRKRGRTPFAALPNGKGVRPLLGVIPKTCKQVGGNALSVLGRRADVVNRGDLFEKDLPRLVDRGAAAERRLGAWQSHDRGSNAADGNTRRIASDGRHDDLRDRLSRACTDFPEPLAAVELPELEGDNQLAGTEHRAAVASVILAEWHAPHVSGAP